MENCSKVFLIGLIQVITADIMTAALVQQSLSTGLIVLEFCAIIIFMVINKNKICSFTIHIIKCHLMLLNQFVMKNKFVESVRR